MSRSGYACTAHQLPSLRPAGFSMRFPRRADVPGRIVRLRFASAREEIEELQGQERRRVEGSRGASEKACKSTRYSHTNHPNTPTLPRKPQVHAPRLSRSCFQTKRRATNHTHYPTRLYPPFELFPPVKPFPSSSLLPLLPSLPSSSSPSANIPSSSSTSRPKLPCRSRAEGF